MRRNGSPNKKRQASRSQASARAHGGLQKLDTSAPEPLYLQIKNMILAKISSGEWRIGAKLPTEAELVETLGVARMTVNRALRELTDERILKRTAGIGTFISERPTHASLFHHRDIAQEIVSRGRTHSCRVLSHERQIANEFIGGRLGLCFGSEVFHSRIVHYANDVPVQLEERWVNPGSAPNYLAQDFTTNTPHEYLNRVVPATEIEQKVHAVAPRTTELNVLHVTKATPMLLIIRRTWSGKTAIMTSRLVSPGDRHSLGDRYKLPK